MKIKQFIIPLFFLLFFSVLLSGGTNSSQLTIRGFVHEKASISIDKALNAQELDLRKTNIDHMVATVSISSSTSSPVEVSLSSSNGFVFRSEGVGSEEVPYIMTYSSHTEGASFPSGTSGGILEVSYPHSNRFFAPSFSDTVVVTISSE